MNFNPRFVVLLALLVAVASPAVARPVVPVSHPAPGHRMLFNPKLFMPTSEIKPGMRGYALTVFKGTKIQRFGIEVMGVIKKYNEGKDYILFRATSGPSVTDHLNIAHGMSGSPIYIDGKMAGAISMEVSNGTAGPSFARDPIGLATPIEDMFDAWSPDLPSKPESMSAGPMTGKSDEYASLDFQPIDLPISVSGVTPDGIARMSAFLAPYHFTLSAGGGGGSTVAKNLMKAGEALQPGAAVGVSLMQGDMDFTATGTVTYRDGNRVLLFGHPFFDLGPIDAALTTASVVGIYPSYQDSVKLGQPLQTVGRIFQDRPFSVGGIVGSLPQMIPMTVYVNDLSIKRQKVFHVRIINHPLLTAQFVTTVAQQAVEQVHGLPGDSMATVTMDADVDQVGKVQRTNTFYDPVNISQAASADVTSLMQLLQANPYYPLALKSLTMHVVIQDGHQTAEIDHIFLPKGQFAPGATIPIGVVLKPYKRARVTDFVNVHIPLDTPDGTLSLTVAGGSEDQGGTISLGGLVFTEPTTDAEPTANIDQLVKQFEKTPRNNSLVATLTLPTSAYVVDGEKLTAVPPTMAAVMEATHSTGVQKQSDEVKVVQLLTYIVTGSQTLSITVQKKNALVSAPAPADSSEAASPDAAPDSAPTDGPDDSESGQESDQPQSDIRPAVFTSIVPAITMADTGLLRESAHVAAAAVPVDAHPAAPAPAAAAKPAALKAVGRMPEVWREDTQSDFSGGNLDNVSISSVGDIRLAGSLDKAIDTPETYIWAIAADGQGSLYLGTGDRGIIYKASLDGKAAPFFNTGQLEVTCLTVDSSGNVYAGTAPHGIVYAIAPDGKARKLFTAPEKYITAMAISKGTLYIATGGGAACIYAAEQLPGDAGFGISPTAKPFFTSPESDILCLTSDSSGSIYAGTAPDGIVYKITPGGKSQVFYDSTQPDIASLAADSSGNIYVGTSPKGEITKVSQDGTNKLLTDQPKSGVLALTAGPNGAVYACAGNTIYRISSDETVQSFTADADQQFISLAADGGAVYAGTSTVGSVYRLAGNKGALQGRYESVVHDAGLPSEWGTILWSADAPQGTNVEVDTRSGDVPQPDSSWSTWSVDSDSTGSAITSPSARYLQYRVILSRDASASPADVPKLTSIAVYYLTRNRAPSVDIVSPAVGADLHKDALLKWNASDPDGDTLVFDVSYSGDSGKTWTLISKRAAPSGPGTVPVATTTPAKVVPPSTVTEKEVQAEVAAAMTAIDHKYPSLPSTVRQKLLTEATAAIRSSLKSQATAPPTAPPAGSGVKETSFSWDTTQVPDGTYMIRVVASDKPSNPVGWLTDTATSQPFLVVNTPPTLTLGTVTVNADKTVTIHGVAHSNIDFVEAVQGHADQADDVAAEADNGMFDTPDEPFTLTLGPLTSGTHSVTVEALDQAQNETTVTQNVTIP